MPHPDSVRLVAAGATKPSEFALAKREVRIGTGAGNELIIHEASVSRRHAKIVRDRAVFRVVDLKSTNGTFVNGRRITGSAVVVVGDELRFGAVRYTIRGGQPLSRSTNRRRRMRPASIAGVVALFFAAAFVATEYMLNWNRMEQAVEHSGNATTATGARSPVTTAANPGATVAHTAVLSESPGGRAGTPTPNAAASAALPPPSGADLAWLKPLNDYRSMAGLNPVAIDPALSAGDAAHARYLIKNYADRIRSRGVVGAEAHREEPASPWYDAAGAKAAAASDVMEGFHTNGKAWLTPAFAIDAWISIPFHRLWILNPNLHRAGYGQYCEGGVCGASLDILTGAGPVAGPTRLTTPIEFPPDESVIKMGSAGGEWPDPLSACPGYTLPMGLPISLQLGVLVDARLSAYSLSRAGDSPEALPACGFDASSYTNPDPQQQTRAREGMHDFGAVVVIPRDPLTPGRYTVSLTASGRQYTWSFTITG